MDDPEDSKPHALPSPTIMKGEADEEKQNRDGETSNNSTNNNTNVPMTMDETLQSFLSSPSVGVLAPGSVGGWQHPNTPTKSHPVLLSSAPSQSSSSSSLHHKDVMIESDPTADEDLIFESAFDLTEERLQYVYNMFDKNEKGNISYENLRHGLEVNCNSASPSGTRLSSSSRTTSGNDYATSSSVTSFLDDASFNQLVSYLDQDQSGDITFQEFAAGIRLLMLRKMVLDHPLPMHPPSSSSSSLPNNNNNNGDNVRVQVMDYNAARLETYIINNNDTTNTTNTTSDRDHPGTKTSSDCNRFASSIASAREMKVTDFYFQDLPSWVKTRWIDVSVFGGGASSIGVGKNGTTPSHAGGTILKQLAIKYSLHPLALEDALSLERNRRPKADVYSSHYFIMVPIFIVEPLLQSPAKKLTERTTTSFLSWMYGILFCRQGTTINDKGEAIKNDNTEEEKQETTTTPTTKVGKIHVQTTSIFVTIPSNDTIITYNSGCQSGGGGDNHSINFNNNFWLRVQKELGKSYSKLRQYDAQYLTYALLDQAVDQIEPIIETIRKEIIHERHILKSNNYYHNTSLDRIHKLRKELEMIVRKLKPFMRLLDHVIEDDTISAGATIYLRDVLDNLECYDEETKDLITLCQSVDMEIDDFQSHKMDQTLFILTIISAIFLPAQFLTGVWGMNFHHMPELDETWGYGMFWCLSIFFSGSFLIFITRIHYYGKF